MAGPEQKRISVEKKIGFFPGKDVLNKKLEESPYKQVIIDFLKKNNVSVENLLTWPEKGSHYLSDMGILRHFLAGNIVIEPFNLKNLTPNSYEVSLGRYYYRQRSNMSKNSSYESPKRLKEPRSWGLLSEEEKGINLAFPTLNPFDKLNIDYIWQKSEALNAGYFTKIFDVKFEGVRDEDEIIVIDPHEMILAHTNEFIGGRNVVSTMISARSSVGRSLLEVCNDANLGHIGYVNRWTLEIKNKSDSHAIPLVVGEKYAQISFTETEPSAQTYQGEYQKGFDLKEITEAWEPKMMLSKMKRSF